MTVTDKSPKRFRFTLVSRLQNYALDVIHETETLETMVVDLLARILGDENDWLSWWIWEKDFGARTELNAFDGDNVIPTDTAQDIYNLILRSKEEEKK